MTEVVAAVTIPAFCGIAALAASFVPAIFGEVWSPTVPILQILALYGLAWIPLSFGHGLMMAIGRPGIFAMLNLIQTCLTLGFCLLAIKWGPVGVASAVFLGMAVYSVVFLAVCRKLVGISFRELTSRLWAPTLVAVVMVGAVSALQASVSEKLGASMTTIAGILLGASIYSAGMAFLRPQLLRQLRQDLLLRVTRLAA
jgi:O-antigen/teichoic acid export membrane protein